MKYKAQVNDHFEFDLSEEAIQNIDLVREDDHTFHILKDNTSFRARILRAEHATKSFLFEINGREYKVNLGDRFDQLVQKLGLEVVAGSVVKDVKAPMPGLVLDVAVNAGQAVEKGDKLLILEAMKMENVIKSDGEGVVKAVHINQGEAVDKGQLLIEME